MNETIETVFSECFFERYGTCLRGGAEEPLYTPAARPGETAVIAYRDDFPASALHEVAHWCIAGPARRELVDYGYWYAPDGRNAAQQREFEQVEVKPQAIEWHFALACRRAFAVSLDNLSVRVSAASGFADAVLAQARVYCTHGLPERAEIFRRALAERCGGPARPAAEAFSLPGA